MFEILRPELSARLRKSQLSSTAGTLKLSWYRGALEADYGHGEFGPVRVATIEARFPGVIVRSQQELPDVIFPGVRSDLATWYLPGV